MEIKNIKKQKGFTLVEIAIVLVIIGLLLGGVLKGQELITNAKIKSVTSDFDGISAAYYAYQDRTGSVAGDDDTSTNTITDPLFWSDLRAQGFISGLSTNSSGPTHSLDGDWTAVDAGDADTTLMAVNDKNSICADKIDGAYAQGMDTKMDDGEADSGSIQSGAAYVAGTLTTICKEL